MTNHSDALNPKPSLVYRIVSYCFVFPVFRIFFRGRTLGVNNIPKTGSLVVVANHGSHLDPPILGHALGRPVAFMAKAELFKVPILSTIIRACGAYPVSRGSSDREAIKIASSKLNDGWATGVFLDGTRQKDGRVNNPMAGAALLAARTNAQILPIAIINSHKALKRGFLCPRLVSIHLRIGKPIQPPLSRKKNELLKTTTQLQLVINSMLDKGLVT